MIRKNVQLTRQGGSIGNSFSGITAIAVYHHAKQQKLTHLIATMEPALVRIFAAFDIPWTPIGAEVDYGGLVRPYLLSLAKFDSILTPAALRFRMGTISPETTLSLQLN